MSENEDRLVARPFTQSNIGMPDAVSDRLITLIDLAASVGEITSKREIIAALISFAAADGGELSSLLHNYRTATVGDIAIQGDLGS